MRLLLVLPVSLTLWGCYGTDPGLYRNDVLAAEASVMATDAITNPETPLQEEEIRAASAFWGFYLRRQHATIRYCETLGVSLSDYAAEFARQHDAEIAKADDIYETFGLTRYDSWRMLSAFLDDVVEKAVEGTAESSRMSPRELCQVFSVYDAQTIAELHFSKALPDAHAVLMASGASIQASNDRASSRWRTRPSSYRAGTSVSRHR